MNLKYILTALVLTGGGWLLGQNDLSSHLLTNSWQALNANPALQPQGIVVNLPGLYNNLWVTNITFNDLVVDENGTQVLDIGNDIGQLGTQNTLRENLDIETIGFGIKIGRLGLSLGHRLRFNALIDYPKTLAQLIWEGNAQFIGQTISFGPSFDLTAYHEIALGASYQFGENVQVGGKVKLLSGGSNLNTSRDNLRLTTSDDVYQLTMDADFTVNSAGTLSYDGLRAIGVNFGFGNFSGENLLAGNSGLAFDLGIAVKLGRIQLLASALDLGGEISWEKDVTNYTLDGRYEFEGLDVGQQLLDNEESFGNVVDSLYNTYEPVETTNNYTTTVGAKYYFGANYELSDEIQVGVLAFTEDYQQARTAALALTGSVQFSPLLRVGAFYGLRNERLDNLGANATLALGPVRVLLATDNIITAFRSKDAHLANFRVGLNLVFGQPKETMGQPEGNRMF